MQKLIRSHVRPISTVRMKASLVVLMLGAAMLPLPLYAQNQVTPEHLIRFSRVRVIASGVTADTITGNPVHVSTHDLFLRGRGWDDRIPLAEIERLEVPAGLSRVQTGALGFVAGATVGFTVAVLILNARYLNDEYNAALALVFAVPPAGIVGALVGSRMSTGRWREIRLIVPLEADFTTSHAP